MLRNIRLFLACLIVCTALGSCTTTIERTVIYQPVIPPIPVLEDPGRPIRTSPGDDEDDELEIILKQAHTIESLMLWIRSVDAQIRALGTDEEDGK